MSSFEYLCDGSTAIINIFIPSVRNLTYKDGTRAEKFKPLNKSLLLGMKWVFKYQYLQMFGLKLSNNY